MPSICKVLSFYSSTRIKGKPMDISKYVTVTINDGRFIPFINRRGPIRTPIAISKGVYETLVSRGYKVIIMASYNKSGKLVPTEQKIFGKGIKLSAVNKGSGDKANNEKVETPASPTKTEDATKEKVEKPTEDAPKKEEVEAEKPNTSEKEKVDSPAKESENKPEGIKDDANEEKKDEEKQDKNKQENKPVNKTLKVFKR